MIRRLLLALSFAAMVAACAGSKDTDRAAEPALPDSVYIEVTNDHFYDARIHAVYQGGQRHTLGTIAGNGGHTEVTLVWEPRALVFEISFIVSGAAYVSYPLDVSRGEYVEVRLPPNIDVSGFFRRVSRN